MSRTSVVALLLVAVVVGTVAYIALVLLFHPILIGVPVISG